MMQSGNLVKWRQSHEVYFANWTVGQNVDPLIPKTNYKRVIVRIAISMNSTQTHSVLVNNFLPLFVLRVLYK